VSLRFHVDRVEYLSGDRHVYGTVAGFGEDTRVIARLPATMTDPLNDGETYEFGTSADQVRFFDAESGERTGPVPLGAGGG
jgi:multiple sugar transport system ATP-binding protein